MIEEGSKAPEFSLPADGGSMVALKDLRGKRVVLYFYPKDDTPGCTIQACDFRDNWKAVQATGAVVLGVSPDGVASHDRFREKFSLPFTLLADEDHAVAERYGVWGEKKLFGVGYEGVVRSTFIIDEEGVVRRAWYKVSAKGHLTKVLEALEAL